MNSKLSTRHYQTMTLLPRALAGYSPASRHRVLPCPPLPCHNHHSPVTRFRPHEASAACCRRGRGSNTIMIIYRGQARAGGGVGRVARGAESVATCSGGVAGGVGGVVRGPVGVEFRARRGVRERSRGQGERVNVLTATLLHCRSGSVGCGRGADAADVAGVALSPRPHIQPTISFTNGSLVFFLRLFYHAVPPELRTGSSPPLPCTL